VVFPRLRAIAVFNKSLDLCFGTKQIYYQQPHRFYYPGLPQIQFYEREQFEWVEAIEAKTDQIRSELLAVINEWFIEYPPDLSPSHHGS